MLYEYLLLNQSRFCEKMSFEERMKDACEEEHIPGAVLVADGPGIHYSKAFGRRSVKEEISAEPLEVDATFCLESCTKLMTTVAALQCVERGLLQLDEDVTKVLPEFKDIKILTDFDLKRQKPTLVRSTRKITLRHLLTHTSGISHPAWNYILYSYLASQSLPVSLTHTGHIENTCLYPLVFEPGTSWEYGAGLDWAGKMVERVNGNIALQQYMETNIWSPLSINTATFRLGERPDLQEKLPDMTIRQGLNHPIYGTTLNPTGRLVPELFPSSDEQVRIVEELPTPTNATPSHNMPGEQYYPPRPNDDFGGSGAYCSAPDFAKLLASLTSNDGKLLAPPTVSEMFTPQLPPEAQASLQKLFAIKEIHNIFSGLPETTPPLLLDWGLGGLIVLEDVPGDADPAFDLNMGMGMGMDLGLGFSGSGDMGRDFLGSADNANEGDRYTGIGGRGGKVKRPRRRGKGSMFWAGFPNLYWWMDREAGVSGFYASQLLPQGDPRSLEYMGRFEEFVYERLGDGRGVSCPSPGPGPGGCKLNL